MVQNYFEVPENIEEEINKIYNVTPTDVDNMVKILKEWLKQQPHLPLEENDLIDQKLKRMLRANKMSLQKTKDKLDMYYSCRSIMSDFYIDREPFKPNIQNMYNIVYVAPVKRSLGHTRLCFTKLIDENVERWDFMDFFRLLINTFELINSYDSCLDGIVVMDLKGVSLAHSGNFNILARAVKTVEKAYSDRLKALHFVNCPSYFVAVVKFLKSALKEKIANRVHLHENYESLQEDIPKEYIPEDCGGEGLSSKKMNDEWRKFVESNADLIAEQNKYKSNEKLRPGKPLDEDDFGLEGSFRKLEVD